MLQIINMQKIVIIPTYNEKENIKNIIEAEFLLEEIFHVLIIDDNSPDGTAQIVENLMSKFPEKLFLLKRSQKMGLGTAYVAGFEWAINHKYQFVFEMDADFSHNPQDLLRLYHQAYYYNNDVVIGSRYISGVNVVNWPLSRVLLSYFASIYVKIITGMKIHDPTAGFVCYQIKVLEKIGIQKIKFIGYAFQIEMKYRSFVKGFKIIEIPIIFTDRSYGESKMSKSIIYEAIFGVIKLRFKKLFGKL